MKKMISFTMAMALSFSAFSATEEEAQAKYAKRGESPEFAAQAAIDFAELALSANKSGNKISFAKLKIQQSESLYYVASQLNEKDEKVAKYLESKNAADEAIKAVVDKEEKSEEEITVYAKSLYSYAAALGQWAKARGPLKSLSEWGNLRRTCQKIIKLKRKSLNFYGAARILGKAYFELPFNYDIGGKKQKKYLTEAYTKTLNEEGTFSVHSLNTLYYADWLIDQEREDEAREILEAFVAADAQTLNPSRIPETLADQETAKKTLEEL